LPYAPPSPCAEPGCGALVHGRYCDDHAKQARKRQRVAIDRGRLSAAKRGYDRVWRRFRLYYLRRNPRCAHCLGPATEIDHIVRLADGGERLDEANLQPLCKRCHWLKGEAEQGRFSLHGLTGIPDGLAPSRSPLTLVCGPPGAGKSTYAAAQAGPGDLVIDLDEISARLAGSEQHQAGAIWLAPAVMERNRTLQRLGREALADRVWFVVGAPKAADRQRWQDDLGAHQVVVLALPAEVCLARIAADRRRVTPLDEYRQAIARWWQQYRPRPGEVTIEK